MYSHNVVLRKLAEPNAAFYIRFFFSNIFYPFHIIFHNVRSTSQGLVIGRVATSSYRCLWFPTTILSVICCTIASLRFGAFINFFFHSSSLSIFLDITLYICICKSYVYVYVKVFFSFTFSHGVPFPTFRRIFWKRLMFFFSASHCISHTAG